MGSSKEKSQKKLTYKDIEHVVEYLVRVKSRTNTFDCWDVDDIGQEIRIICLHALSSFKPEEADSDKKILNYFGTCVDNRLRNLRRDKYIRFSPPFNKATVREIEDNPEENKAKYEKLQGFRQGIEEQKKIKHPTNIDVIGEGSIKSWNCLEEEILAKDMQQYIVDNIEDNLRAPLKSLLIGDKRKVNIRLRRRIQESVRTILEQ